MSKLKIILFLILTLFYFSSISQENYIQYHKGIVKAENAYLDSNFTESFLIYDSIFSGYKFLFVRDCFKAAQYAIIANDHFHAFKYLELSVKYGVRLETIKSNQITAILLTDPNWQPFIKKYDSLINLYYNNINWKLREACLIMFFKDQEVREWANKWYNRNFRNKHIEQVFSKQNESQVYIIEKMFKEYGYPGNKLIGIGNDTIPAPLTWNNNLSSLFATIILYHYKETWNKLNLYLFEALKKGEISPFEYAMIRDYQEIYNVKKFKDCNAYYLALNRPTKYTINEINAHRLEIGLNTIENEKRLKTFSINYYKKYKLRVDLYLEPLR